MSGFNNNSYKFRRVHARRNATHGCMPRTTPCKEVLSSLLPPAFENFQRQARIARNKGTILTSCLGQREPLLEASFAVRPVAGLSPWPCIARDLQQPQHHQLRCHSITSEHVIYKTAFWRWGAGSEELVT